LEPNGQIWWVREGDNAEMLFGQKHMYRPVDELWPGDTVIVPRGEGREALFTRLVRVSHGAGDVAAFEVFFSRWRNGCLQAFDLCGRDWNALEEQMRDLGSGIGWQAIRSWAVGTTMGPEDGRDIYRVGRIVEDPFLTKEAARINAMLREVRTLHVRLGHLLSAALLEALDGHGPNLQKLSSLLQLDVTELLEEFEIRTVRSVGAAQDARASIVGKVAS
jgi:hypothetical protein